MKSSFAKIAFQDNIHHSATPLEGETKTRGSQRRPKRAHCDRRRALNVPCGPWKEPHRGCTLFQPVPSRRHWSEEINIKAWESERQHIKTSSPRTCSRRLLHLLRLNANERQAGSLAAPLPGWQRQRSNAELLQKKGERWGRFTSEKEHWRYGQTLSTECWQVRNSVDGVTVATAARHELIWTAPQSKSLLSESLKVR